jgi:hypothetical protein
MAFTTEAVTRGLLPVDIDQPIHDGQGDELGKIDRVVVDLEHNRIAYATLRLNDSFDSLAVPWAELWRDRAGEFHLNVDLETLRSAPRPEFTELNAPWELDDHGDRWLRELYLFYGHVPYRSRTMR